MHFLAEFFESQARLIRRTGTDAVPSFTDKGKQSKHGKAFQGQQDFAAGASLHFGQNLQILPEQSDIDQITGSVSAGPGQNGTHSIRSQLNRGPWQTVSV